MAGIHDEVRIVRGIQVAPGDTGSAETGYTIIDLLSGSAEGFALKSDADGWYPALPAPKAGLWNDVAFEDGRSPYAGAEANVTETMRITITASTQQRMAELLMQLFRMVEDCKRFWFDEFYCQPVFLHWWAHGAPGRQYALIMQIDADVVDPSVDDVGNIVRDVVLTIEREPFWRWEVPPGANPIYWTLYAQGRQPGLNYDYAADLRLLATSSAPLLYALATATIENCVTYTTLTNTVNTILSENALHVPAASIPGDAPALVQLSLRHVKAQPVTPLNFTYLIALSTRTRLRTMRTNFIARFVTMLPFTAGSYTDALQADAGGIGGYNVTTGTTIAQSRVAITPGLSLALEWGAAVGLDSNIQRGRFAVFVRCRQNAGSAGDITLRIGFRRGDLQYTYTNTVAAPLQAGTGATTTWPVLYMGTVRLPSDRDMTLATLGSVGGSGQFNNSGASAVPMGISLEVARSTGVALLYFLDVVLLPYDEVLLDTLVPSPAPSAAAQVIEAVVVDNTGYLSRGKPQQVVMGLNVQQNPTIELDAFQTMLEQIGSDLVFQPGVDNSVYILEKNQVNESVPSDTTVPAIEASVNIVPRSRGIRTG